MPTRRVDNLSQDLLNLIRQASVRCSEPRAVNPRGKSRVKQPGSVGARHECRKVCRDGCIRCACLSLGRLEWLMNVCVELSR